MMCEIKLWWGVLLLFSLSCLPYWVHGTPQVPCFFIFGDSLSDSGNNNNLNTLAKVNYGPYGIDFPGGKQTGRFCNGRTIVDFLATHLGFDNFMPSFKSATNANILLGVNYASGSAGIRDETGQHLGECMSLDKQLKNHQVAVSRIVDILGNNNSAVQHLNKCLYYVAIGSNDYLNNYLLPQKYPTSKDYSPEKYAKILIDQYSKQIRTLYDNGARKLALVGLGKMGCSPHAIDTYGTNGSACVDNINEAAQLFNTEVNSLVDQLNKDLPNAKLIYINSYAMAEGDPSMLGFKVVNKGCCKVREDGQCIPNQAPCPNRAEYVFWDSFHPTEALNVYTAARTYSAFAPTDSSPFDVHDLALFDL